MTHTHGPARSGWFLTGLAAAALAGVCALAPDVAQAQQGRGERGASMGGRGGGGMRGPGAGGGRNFSGGPRVGLMQGGDPRMMQRGGARIEPRIRSGAIDGRRNIYAGRQGYGGAAPLTITRNPSYANNNRYRYDRRYERRNSGWFPGILAAPFLLPGAVLGAGYYGDEYGYNTSYGYASGPGYDPYLESYDYPPYQPPVGYPGPVSYGGEVGGSCATPQKVCQLYTPAEVGVGCSCRAPAGLPRFRGVVVP